MRFRTTKLTRYLAAAVLLYVGACKEEEPQPIPKRSPGMRAPAAERPQTPSSPEPADAPHGKVVNPHATAASVPAFSGDPTSISAAGIELTAPKDWKRETPSSTGMGRMAQFRIQSAGGDADVVLYYFGQGQGGAAEQNIKRWRGQVSNPDKPDSPAEAETADFEQNGLHVKTVSVRGTYTPSMLGMGSGPTGPRPDYILYAAIIEGGPEGTIFVKITGPEATLKPQMAAVERFVKSARVAKS